MHTLEENKANRLKQPIARRVFREGSNAKGRSYEDYRSSRFKHFAPADMRAGGPVATLMNDSVVGVRRIYN